MNRLVRAELRKVRTTRVPVAALASAPLIAALVTYAIFSTAGRDGNAPLGPGSLHDAIAGPASIVTVLVLLLGVLAAAGEHHHGTITTTYLATPRRGRVLAAKSAAVALVGAGAAVTSIAVAGGIATAWLRSEGITVGLGGADVRLALGFITSAMLSGVLGVALGTILRNQTAAAIGVLVWLLGVEGVVATVVGADSALRWLPVAAIGATVRVDPGPGALSTGAALVAVLAWVAATTALARGVAVRRDVA